jgi:hypothetical protein
MSKLADVVRKVMVVEQSLLVNPTGIHLTDVLVNQYYFKMDSTNMTAVSQQIDLSRDAGDH